MIDELISILEGFEYPVYKQGSRSEEEEYPPTMITFWNADSPSQSFYDNEEYSSIFYYTVYVYSDDPDITYSLTEEIRTALKEAGWVIDGHGYDVPSDVKTHTGRGLDAIYLKVKEA